MESYSLYNGYNPTALYLPLQALSPRANFHETPFEDFNLRDDRIYSASDRYDYTQVKRRNTQLNWPLLTLPLKKSVQGLLSNQPQEVEPSTLVPTSSFAFERMKEPVTLPLLSLQSSGRIRSPEEPLAPFSTSTSTNLRLTECDQIGDTAVFDNSKPLLSPIRFTSPSDAQTHGRPSLERLNKGNEASTYLFYPPSNPADRPAQAEYLHSSVPRRQLFYGEAFVTPKPKPLHNATGSLGLRRRARWESIDDDLGCWSKEYSTSRPYYSEPARSKPIIPLGLAEEGESIEEAHATTVTSSPSKPQLICIPRRGATTTTTSSARSIHQDQPIPNIFPATPPHIPASPFGLGIDSLESSKREKEHLAFEKIKARPTWTSTPPALAMTAPASTEDTLRCIPPTSTPKTRPDTPRPFQPQGPQLSELTTWILTELEHSLSSSEPRKLQLNNPVIQQLRLSPAQRRVPRPSPPTLPLSRYSTYNPLSSNPPSVPTTATDPQSTSLAPLTGLRLIFPDAQLSLLDELEAIIIAHQHVSSIYLPSPSPASNHTSSATSHMHSSSPSQNILLHSADISYIPSKARAMLGLQPSSTARAVRPTLPDSWLKPQVLTWGERVDELETGLGREAERLVGECLGDRLHGERRGGKVEGALLRAVREVVRLAEVAR